MAKSKAQIANDLLRAANYYWHDDNDDQVHPLDPNDFDPVIDKIFKANAVELEKLYAEIAESKHAIAISLAQAIVPDQSLLPQPGYTVAQIVPKASHIQTTPQDRYQMVGQTDTGEKVDFYFTPLFDHQYPKCQLSIIITENQVLATQEIKPRSLERWSSAQTTSAAWLGLHLDKVVAGDQVSFYVGNQIMDAFDKDYQLFQKASWHLANDLDRSLTTTLGIAKFSGASTTESDDLLDQLEIPHTYYQKIIQRLKHSFIHLTLPEDWSEHLSPLPEEFASHVFSEYANDDPLLWIKLQFELPVQEDFFMNNQVLPNSIPLVNRSLLENYVVKRGYDRIVLPLRTRDFFLDLHRVSDSQDADAKDHYQRVDLLHPQLSPGTFLLRESNRMRRLNREDATRQIQRLLEVIQEEYRTFKEEGVHRLREDFEIIEKAINRIKSQLPQYFREAEHKSTYYGMAHFRSGTSRLYYSYWETQGDLIKYLGEKTGLSVSSGDVKITASQSVIPIQRGQGQLTPDDYLNELKMVVSSGGKINSQADIEHYCHHRYRNTITVDRIVRKLMMMQSGRMGRGLVVVLKLNPAVELSTGRYVALELQNELNTKSAFFTEIKVEIEE